MGKATGFMEFNRKNCSREDALNRVNHWNEFDTPLTEEERRKQGARCMDCGVPFCQSGVMLNNMATGCPLHNLIPEWNNFVYLGKWELGLERLLKTSNFPEFTSRVCPALCENACTCGLHGDAVTVKANGKKEVIDIAIKPEVVDPDDIEMLQDLVLSAVNEALRKVDDMQQSQMSKVTGGMNIPGLF